MAANGIGHGDDTSDPVVDGNNQFSVTNTSDHGTDGTLDGRMGKLEMNEGKDEMQNFTKHPSEWTPEEQQMARDIIRQVEHYFSDDNLKRDSYLYGRMRGSKNQPVHISKIHEFRKMRDFQPYSFVVDALRTSQVLRVEKNKKTGELGVVRREPFIRGEHVIGHDLPRQKGTFKIRPTGFEEFYADAPITPQQAAEEAEMYDPSIPFADRIEVAIQRFKARRRFHPDMAHLWTMFVKFGGIITGPKQFTGGLTQEDFEDRTAAEIARMTATEHVGDDKWELEGPGAKWKVDFEAVAKGFLGTIMGGRLETEEDVNKTTNLLVNFYNYLIRHDVCPEYHEQLLAARRVCAKANRELLDLPKFGQKLPGDFNSAALVLFGEDRLTDLARLRAAKPIFSLGAASNAPESWFSNQGGRIQKEILEDQYIADKEELVGFEVTQIFNASDDVKEMYEPTGMRPTGKLLCKPWKMPTLEDEDLPKGYKLPPRPDNYEFWIEQDALDHCSIGIKFEATVSKLSSGLYVINYVSQTYPSFYTVLLNELLYSPGSGRRWKEPREITREERLEKERGYLPVEEEPNVDESKTGMIEEKDEDGASMSNGLERKQSVEVYGAG